MTHDHPHDHSHDHGHHHHHDHTHESDHTHELSFEQKLEKLFSHWIDHNESHKETFATWAKRADEAGLGEVSVQLDAVAKLSEEVTVRLKSALNALHG